MASKLALLGVSGKATPWYLSGGAPAPVVVYQPKGARTYAESLINLANPGTYNAAAVGSVAPLLMPSAGWYLDGTNSFNSGYVPATGGSYFALFDITDVANKALLGCYKSGACAQINPDQGGTDVKYINGTDDGLTISGKALTGTLAMAGNKAYRNGSIETGDIPGWTTTTTLPMYVGATTTNGSNQTGNVIGTIRLVAFWASVLTAGQVAAIHAAASAYVGGVEYMLVCDGDSLTSGFPGTDAASYPSVLRGLLGGRWASKNYGVGGQTMAQALSDAATQIDANLDSGLTNIVALWCGANDLIAHRSAADIYADMTTYLSGRETAGFKSVILTTTKATQIAGGDETARQALVALIIANSAGADAVVDVASLTEFSDPTNVTYFTDGIHMTAAGYALVGVTVAPYVLGLV